MENIILSKWIRKQAGAAIHMFNKVDLTIELVRKSLLLISKGNNPLRRYYDIYYNNIKL